MDANPWFLYWRADPAPLRTARRTGWIVAALLSVLLWVAGWTLRNWWTNLRKQAIHQEVSRSAGQVLDDARTMRISGSSLQDAQESAVGVAREVRSRAAAI